MGIGAVGASALLAACGGDDDSSDRAGGDAAATTTSAGPAAPTTPPVPTQPITYPGRGEVTLQGAWAPAETARGAVLVIHENQGLTDHIRSVAGRLARDGFSALAVDLLSAEGGTAAVRDPGAVSGVLTRLSDRFVGDMRSSLDELERREPGAKLGAVGFCFGGMQVWDLLASGEQRLAAAVPFYGPANNPEFSDSDAAVLAVYGERDDRVNATRDAARRGLEAAGLPHEIRTFPDAGHGFFNETRPNSHNRTQAALAYEATIDWLGRYLA